MDGAPTENPQGTHGRGAETDSGSEAAQLVFTLPSLELGGDSSAAQAPHVGTSPGVFPVLLAGAPCHLPSQTYLSYLLCRSFSICGSTVVHRSSFHRELGRGPGTYALSTGPAHSARSTRHGHLRFLVDDVEEVHHHGQVTDGHGRIH